MMTITGEDASRVRSVSKDDLSMLLTQLNPGGELILDAAALRSTFHAAAGAVAGLAAAATAFAGEHAVDFTLDRQTGEGSFKKRPVSGKPEPLPTPNSAATT